MEQQTVLTNQDDLAVKELREKLRVKKEEQIKRLLCRIAGLPKHKKIFEINIELGMDICFENEELFLNLERLGEILVYRAMCKEICPAADLDLCIGGLKDLATKAKCDFCDGHGTAEWDNY